MGSLLFSPLTIRSVTIPNRVVMPPLLTWPSRPIGGKSLSIEEMMETRRKA
jgi:2,4-dienoyl-CoA reductase-like NADH-dependent reductase (Old Yellow Enzyme family)